MINWKEIGKKIIDGFLGQIGAWIFAGLLLLGYFFIQKFEFVSKEIDKLSPTWLLGIIIFLLFYIVVIHLKSKPIPENGNQPKIITVMQDVDDIKVYYAIRCNMKSDDVVRTFNTNGPRCLNCEILLKHEIRNSRFICPNCKCIVYEGDEEWAKANAYSTLAKRIKDGVLK